ncbi:MAG: Hpt domain-containing protein [Pseudolabrys sp.]|nr:Hpt domain-containing protein [Pseudolabrys sp.]
MAEGLPASPARAPARPAIDRAHLERMTGGDAALAREVLRLFDGQAAMLLSGMCGAPPSAMAVLAHRLRGSAIGVGAWEVARAAMSVERAAAPAAGTADRQLAIADLAAAIEEVRTDIAALLGDRC